MSPLAASCHSVPGLRKEGLPTIALIGSPNVGKSTLFNALTGLCALTTNYPGTTVEVAVGTASVGRRLVQVLDLPGTYGLTAAAEDERIAWDALLRSRPDAVVAVADATNLARNLYLVLQLLDLGFPVIVALNLSDAAERSGLRIDARHLEELLGVQVVPTVATTGHGLCEIATRIAAVLGTVPHPRHRYDRDLEHAVAELSTRADRAGAFIALERNGDAALFLEPATFAELRDAAAEWVARLESSSGEPVQVRVARARHVLADRLAAQVTVGDVELRWRQAWRVATRPLTGIPLLAVVLAAIFALLFWGGSLLAGVIDRTWVQYASPLIRALLQGIAGEGLISRTLLWGLDAGLNAVLSVGLPYVLTFYLLLAVLEDTGYLTAAAVILDRTLGRMGLTGRAAIPLVAGAGCNVPAIIGLRVLRTERERLIAGTLITLTPCSARTAVIFGAVARFLGWPWALALYAIVTAVILGAGWGLNRLIPGRESALLMEIFPFRVPGVRTVLRKTWFRVREFAFVAVPIVLGGSIVLGALYETGWMRYATMPLAPIVGGWLRLPAVAGLTLVFAVLRKELALQLLVALAIAQFGAGATDLRTFMSGPQIFTYALVNTIYVPCVATIAVLSKALGWRRAALISVGTVMIAVLLGGIVIRILQ